MHSFSNYAQIYTIIWLKTKFLPVSTIFMAILTCRSMISYLQKNAYLCKKHISA